MNAIVRTPALILIVLAWGCTGSSAPTDGGSIDAASIDAGSIDAPTDTGVASIDAPAGVDFFNATGSYNAMPFTAHCGAAQPQPLVVSLTGPGLVQIACNAFDANRTVHVSAIEPTVGVHTMCRPGPPGVLVSIDGHSLSNPAGVGCEGVPGATLSMDVTEFTHNPDGTVTWAATFTMTASQGGDSGSVTGSFRVTARH